MSEVYIHSTLTCDTKYCVYMPADKLNVNQTINHVAKDAKGREIVLKVNGGANCTNKALIMVDGAVTEASKELVDLIREKSFQFRFHEQHGFITVKDYHRTDVRDMEKKDGSAQLTAADFKKRGRKAPRTRKDDMAGGDDDE